MKRCARCKLEKPVAAFGNDRSQKDGKDRRCKECAAAHNREMKQRNGEKMKAARRARHKERMATDPEYRERVRRQNREKRRLQRARDPEKHRKYVRDRYYRIRNDPQKWAEFLEKRRAYMADMRENDKQRYEALLEARRIMHRLRRIEAGLPVRAASAIKNPHGAHVEKVDATPLVPLIEAWIKRYEAENGDSRRSAASAPTLKTLAANAGVSTQAIRRIRNGQEKIALDTADKLCVALGYPFSLVYEEEDSQ